MTFEQVIKRLTDEMVLQTGHEEDLQIYQDYIQIALVIGSEQFSKDKGEIVALDEAGNEAGRFINVNQAAIKLNVDRQNIDQVLKGNRIHAGEYTFIRKYKNET